MKLCRIIAAALAVAAFTCAGTAQADVQKFMNLCNGKLCASYQLVLTPPDGWMIDREATAKNKVQIIVPKGTTFHDAPALIYVQVFYHPNKQQSLADFADVSNNRWLASVKDAKISALAPVERKNGKPGFLRFAFENPSKAQQAYELGAFDVDNDKDGNEFIPDVVMTGGDKTALDRAEKDYIAFLKAH